MRQCACKVFIVVRGLCIFFSFFCFFSQTFVLSFICQYFGSLNYGYLYFREWLDGQYLDALLFHSRFYPQYNFVLIVFKGLWFRCILFSFSKSFPCILYFVLFFLVSIISLIINKITSMAWPCLCTLQLDYAARDKDASLIRQCYENIVLVLNEVLSRL